MATQQKIMQKSGQVQKELLVSWEWNHYILGQGCRFPFNRKGPLSNSRDISQNHFGFLCVENNPIDICAFYKVKYIIIIIIIIVCAAVYTTTVSILAETAVVT